MDHELYFILMNIQKGLETLTIEIQKANYEIHTILKEITEENEQEYEEQPPDEEEEEIQPKGKINVKDKPRE